MTSNQDAALLAVERQRIIADILKREGAVRTVELCELLHVSAVTIRTDLRDLETAGLCDIIWGGAVSKLPPTEQEAYLEQRSVLNSERKKRIGQRAAQLISSGQTILVDAGTTTVEIVKCLPPTFDYLRVITPALNVAMAASQFAYAELIMPGGILRPVTRSLIGPQTLQALRMFNADWTFIASGGFDLAHGVTTANTLEAEVKRTMVEQSARVALVADSSKYGHVCSLNVAALNQIDVLITDSDLPDRSAFEIEAAGVQVIRA